MSQQRLLLCAALSIAALLLGAAGVGAHPAESRAGAGAAVVAPATVAHPAPQFAAHAVSPPASPLAARSIAATRMISVPFGFSETLLLNVDQQAVQVSGPGACAAGQQFTVAISITQSLSGATANGQVDGTCSGADDQGFAGSASVTSGPPLALGAAQACGLATTSDSGGMTDQMQWCRDVVLAMGTYLPVVER